VIVRSCMQGGLCWLWLTFRSPRSSTPILQQFLSSVFHLGQLRRLPVGHAVPRATNVQPPATMNYRPPDQANSCVIFGSGISSRHRLSAPQSSGGSTKLRSRFRVIGLVHARCHAKSLGTKILQLNRGRGWLHVASET
jgi:hypothetical protein